MSQAEKAKQSEPEIDIDSEEYQVTLEANYGLTELQSKAVVLIIELGPDATQEDLAKKIGCDRSSLWAWRRLKNFQDALSETAMNHLGSLRGQIMKVQIQRALDGSLDAAKWLYEISGPTKPEDNGSEDIQKLIQRVGVGNVEKLIENLES